MCLTDEGRNSPKRKEHPMTPKRTLTRGLVWAVAGASAFGLGLGATSLVNAASSSTTDTAVVSTNTGTGSNSVPSGRDRKMWAARVTSGDLPGRSYVCLAKAPLHQ